MDGFAGFNDAVADWARRIGRRRRHRTRLASNDRRVVAWAGTRRASAAMHLEFAPVTLPFSGVGEHLAQLRGERVRITGLAIFAAKETTMVAREDHGLDTKPLSNGNGAAVRQLAR